MRAEGFCWYENIEGLSGNISIIKRVSPLDDPEKKHKVIN